jgi:hypothetical protein
MPDENAKKGMAPDLLASQIVEAVENRAPELIAAQLDGRVAIWLRTLWPRALFKVMQWKGAK